MGGTVLMIMSLQRLQLQLPGSDVSLVAPSAARLLRPQSVQRLGGPQLLLNRRQARIHVSCVGQRRQQSCNWDCWCWGLGPRHSLAKCAMRVISCSVSNCKLRAASCQLPVASWPKIALGCNCNCNAAATWFRVISAAALAISV